MSKTITVSLAWDEYDRIVDEANIGQATSLAQDIKRLMDIESPKTYQVTELQDCLKYLDAYLTVIRYTHRSEDAEKIIAKITSIYNNEVENEI
jgi:hypothetical protein